MWALAPHRPAWKQRRDGADELNRLSSLDLSFASRLFIPAVNKDKSPLTAWAEKKRCPRFVDAEHFHLDISSLCSVR